MTVAALDECVSIGQSARISDSDVRALRRAYYGDGQISELEASRLLALAVSYDGESDAWPHFFIEALTDHLVYQVEPRGYVSSEQAGWLMSRIAAGDAIRSGAILELLVKVLEVANEVPDELAAFVLAEVQTAILTGNARMLGEHELSPGVIGEAEVELLRRILYAAGGDRNAGVSRAEAEVLFDLNDTTRDAENHWSWPDLFAKAIVNHLMAANHRRVMSRQDALRIAKWLEAPSGGVGGFMSRMFNREMLSLKDAYQEVTAADPVWSRLEGMHRDEMAAEPVTQQEASWLVERIGRDGTLHDTEKAVLRFIRDECPEIHAGLEPLLARL